MCDTASPEGVDWCGDEGTSLRLEDGRGSGRGGINRLVGSYELPGERLRFGPLATTLMAGLPERMEAERLFLAALARVAAWSVDAAEGDNPRRVLTLLDDNGAELLRLEECAGPDAD
jgi:heat shock protein HslJ